MILSLGITPKNYAPLVAAAANDADAQAFIDAAGITDATQQSAVNQLVLDLKSANIWTKMKAIYPIVGGTASTHKWNLKDPRDLDAAFRLTFATGWTHASTGMTPNGATYANTYLVPSSAITLNSVHISYYSRTNITPAASTDIGSWTNTSTNYTLLALGTTLGSYAGLQQTSFSDYPVFADADSRGFYMATRTSSSLSSIYKNGVLKDTSAQTSTGNGTNSFYIGSGNGNNPNYSTKQCAFASIGDGLTDAEAANFYTAVQNYQTTLGRNV
jgi:hypothetical protein